MKSRTAAALFAFALSVAPIAAHHSVVETFDTTKELTIQGVVSRIEWVNPHGRFWLETKNADGTISIWEFELPPPNSLRRAMGLDFVKLNDQVTVQAWRAKSGALLGNVLDLSGPSGVVKFSRATAGWVPLNPR